MQTHNTDSGLGEALASYQPTSLSPATWARFREDAVALVARLEQLDEYSARKSLSRLAVFIADLAVVRPDATLGDLLTPEQVAGYLERERAYGAPAGTLENRQGTLNALLRVADGQDRSPDSPRSAEPRLAPHDRDRLMRLVGAAVADGSPEAADFARTVLAALTGARFSSSRPVHVTIDAGTVIAGDSRRRFSTGVPLPPGGTVDADAIERGRRWVRDRHGFRLDLRRLLLTHIAEVVATRPALEALQMDGVGRDRLSAALAAAPAVDEEATRRLLRGPAA